jgi:hypothetical protein
LRQQAKSAMPPHEKDTMMTNNQFPVQRFHLMIPIFSSNAASTTINNTPYGKAVMIGRDNQEVTLWRSCAQVADLVFPLMDLIDGFKQTANCFSQSIASVVLSNLI